MKKRFLSVVSICIVLALSACSLSAGRKNTAFRNTCWGDDIETIKKVEKIPITEVINNDYVGKNQDFEGIEATIFYHTDPNYGLYRGAYVFDASYDNIFDYISDYEKIKSSLVETYGEPTKTEKNITSRYLDKWINNETNTEITLYLETWKTEDCDLWLIYEDMNYKNS